VRNQEPATTRREMNKTGDCPSQSPHEPQTVPPPVDRKTNPKPGYVPDTLQEDLFGRTHVNTQHATLLLAPVFLFTLIGCEASVPTAEQWKRSYEPLPKYTSTIEVISDPPGARIEVNQDYVGDAPIAIEVRTTRGNESFFKEYTIRALPIIAGQETQTKYFRVYDPVPGRVLFDMNLKRIPGRIELHVEHVESSQPQSGGYSLSDLERWYGVDANTP